jgi:membrane associated rhomboid family serine protease
MVLAIIAVNVFVFLVLERAGHNAAWIDRYALYPVAVHQQHQIDRIFTAMFLHANFLHIFFNMIALLIVGPAVEVLLGKARFVTLYLVAGLGGSVGSYLLSQPGEIGVGASGAIMGVIGAYIVIGLRRRLPVAPVVGLLVVNIAIGFSGSIDWRAHLGGVVTGGGLALLYDYAGRRRDRVAELSLTIGGTAAVVGLMAILVSSISPGLVALG